VLRFAANDGYGGHDPIISKFSIELLDESRKALERKLINANFAPQQYLKGRNITIMVERTKQNIFTNTQNWIIKRTKKTV
jgi:hypothetical protein